MELARILEDAKFHLAFFDDRLAMPDKYGDQFGDSVSAGIRCVKLDPIVTLGTMAAVTDRLGLAATSSTTYFEPFDTARRIATLDALSEGRAAWNVVTSLNDSEARNMGHDALLPHDQRYDRADEFMDVVMGHWRTWAPDAINHDRGTAVFADPSKVQPLNHEGRYFSSKGPFTVPRSPQGRPVVVQAGSSGRGRQFAGKWADIVFAIAPTLELAQRGYAATKDEATAHGRSPEDIIVCNLITPVCAQTRAEAEDKLGQTMDLVREIDALVLLSEALNFDFAQCDPASALTDEQMASMQGMLAIRDIVVRLADTSNPTPLDFVRYSRHGQPQNPVVGTPSDVADRLQEIYEAHGADGFMIAANSSPDSYRDFAEFVVPELQRRGLFHRDYEAPTLRGNLGIAVP